MHKMEGPYLYYPESLQPYWLQKESGSYFSVILYLAQDSAPGGRAMTATGMNGLNERFVR